MTKYFLVLFHANNLPIYINSIAYIEFKTEAEAEKMLEEAQGADVQGRSIMVDFVGEKSQKGAKMSGKYNKYFWKNYKIMFLNIYLNI